MKFRGVDVYPLVVAAPTRAELEHKLSELDKLYDLQYSITQDKSIRVFSALALIELEKESIWQKAKRKLKKNLKQLLSTK